MVRPNGSKFSVSSDETFGAIDAGDEKRFSLIHLPLGLVKIYLISIRKKKFDLIKVVNLNQLRPWPEANNATGKLVSYNTLITAEDDNTKLEVQARYLAYKIDSETNLKTSLQNKVSIYNAILLLVAGYVAFLFNEIIKNWHVGLQSYALIFIFFVIFLSFINCLVFIYVCSKNKPITRSTFSDLKSDSTLKKFLGALYFDWYNLKDERDVLSNYVKNIEKNLVVTIIITFILSVAMPIFDHLQIKDSFGNTSEEAVASITLLDGYGDFNQDKLITLPAVLDGMLSRNIKTIYIIKSDIVRNKEKYEQVLNTLALFSQKVEIKEIDVSDFPDGREVLIIKPEK